MDLAEKLEKIKGTIVLMKISAEHMLYANEVCPSCVPKIILGIIILNICLELAELKIMEIKSKQESEVSFHFEFNQDKTSSSDIHQRLQV